MLTAVLPSFDQQQGCYTEGCAWSGVAYMLHAEHAADAGEASRHPCIPVQTVQHDRHRLSVHLFSGRLHKHDHSLYTDAALLFKLPFCSMHR